MAVPYAKKNWAIGTAFLILLILILVILTYGFLRFGWGWVRQDVCEKDGVRLTLFTDKATYHVGDKIRVRVDWEVLDGDKIYYYHKSQDELPENYFMTIMEEQPLIPAMKENLDGQLVPDGFLYAWKPIYRQGDLDSAAEWSQPIKYKKGTLISGYKYYVTCAQVSIPKYTPPNPDDPQAEWHNEKVEGRTSVEPGDYPFKILAVHTHMEVSCMIHIQEKSL